MNLSPLPIQKFFDNNGNPLVGGLLFTYIAGTSTKVATYRDQAGTLNPNPVVLDFRGEANVWLDQTLTYKFVLAPAGDTDPPTKPIWTVDNISAAVTYASLTAAIIGQILYQRTTAEINAGVTPSDYSFPSHETVAGKFLLRRYGWDTTGTVAANTAWSNMMAVVAQVAHGGEIVTGPGNLRFNVNPGIITTQDEYRIYWDARGTKITSTGGATTDMRVQGGTTIGGLSVYGAYFDDHGNTNVTSAVDVVGTSRVRWFECHYRPGGNTAAYAPVLYRNSDPADANTGSYWGKLVDCSFRRLTGADGALPTYSVILRGNPHAFEARGGELGDATTVVRVEPEAAQTTVLNGCLINGVAFENFTTAINLSGVAATEFGGFRCVDSRFEPSGAGTLFSFTGSTTQPVVSPFMAGNYLTPDVTVYLNNPNSLRYRSLDDCSNPQVRPQLQNYRGMLISTAQAGQHGLIVQPPEAGKGLVVTDNAGAIAAILAWEGNDNKARLSSNDVGEMGLTCIRGISGSGTDAKNLAGTDTFAGATLTKTIAFAVAEPDASYRVMVTPTSDWGAQTKIPWITAKGTGGFTVNVQATTTSGTFDWLIVRT